MKAHNTVVLLVAAMAIAAIFLPPPFDVIAGIAGATLTAFEI